MTLWWTREVNAKYSLQNYEAIAAHFLTLISETHSQWAPSDACYINTIIVSDNGSIHVISCHKTSSSREFIKIWCWIHLDIVAIPCLLLQFLRPGSNSPKSPSIPMYANVFQWKMTNSDAEHKKTNEAATWVHMSGTVSAACLFHIITLLREEYLCYALFIPSTECIMGC